jgi:hypothetical protein
MGTSAAREKRSGAGGGLQGAGRPVWLSFVSIHRLLLVCISLADTW